MTEILTPTTTETALEDIFENVITAALDADGDVWQEEVIDAREVIPAAPAEWRIKVLAAHDHEWGRMAIVVLDEDGEQLYAADDGLTPDPDEQAAVLARFERYAGLLQELLVATAANAAERAADILRGQR